MKTFITIEIDSPNKKIEREGVVLAMEELLENTFDVSTHRFDEMSVKTEIKRIAETAQERIMLNG
jgi:hypothetical protein